MMQPKVTASKLVSAFLAVALVAALLAGLLANPTRHHQQAEKLSTYDVEEAPPAPDILMQEAVEEPMAPAPGIVPPGVVPPGIVPPLPHTAPAPIADPSAPGQGRYDPLQVNRELAVARAPVSTFAVDVDTASYANVRRMIRAGEPVLPEAVRVEELVNYFRYDLARPDASAPIRVTTDVARTPWNSNTLLLRVALATRDVPAAARPPANLVFLVDISGSMDAPDRIGLVKRALLRLAEQVRPQDRVSIVTYAGEVGVALAPTSDRNRIRRTIAGLGSGGGTAGGAGLALAYQQARRGFIAGGINRVVLATDGDFNVGVSDPEGLRALVERERDQGVTLSTLGVGEYNDRLMETLADAGDGNASFIDGNAEIEKVLGRELSATLQVVAKDVKAQLEFNPAAIRSYRQIGYENRQLAERDFDDDRIDAGDLGAGHQVTALYEITPVADGVAARRRYAVNRAGGAKPAVAPEALFVKIRYKEPAGGPSRLLQQAVPGELLARAREPAGDTAFAAAVAAWGQHLRGDPAVTGFAPAAIVALAGPQRDLLRREFLDLVRGVPAAPAATAPDAMSAGPWAMPPAVADVPARGSATGPALMLALTALVLGLALFLALRWRRARAGLVAGDAAPCPALAAAEAAAALSTDSDTVAALDRFQSLAARARTQTLRGGDGDVATEVEAILDRHAPNCLRDYAAARARAASGREGDLEGNLRAALGTLSARLAELLDQQTSRDVQRIDAHGRFLRQRHQPPLAV